MNDNLPSIQQTLAIPFKKYVNTLALDYQGRFALLAGNKALYVLDLENPRTPSWRTTQRESKRAVSCAEWNPHASHSSLAATAANTFTYLWDLRSESNAGGLVASINTHRRAVSDLNWSPHDPTLIATCSADTYVNLWDVRNPKNSLKLKSYCGYTAAATQVKWSRLDSMLLASAHGGEVRVWDVRHEFAPLALITAHMSKITWIDWSHTDGNRFLTCGQDRTVKFWDADQPRECRGTLHTGAPLIKALYAPRGESDDVALYTC